MSDFHEKAEPIGWLLFLGALLLLVWIAIVDGTAMRRQERYNLARRDFLAAGCEEHEYTATCQALERRWQDAAAALR